MSLLNIALNVDIEEFSTILLRLLDKDLQGQTAARLIRGVLVAGVKW